MELKELTVKVCEDTAQHLQEAAKGMHLTVGEVLDRVVLDRIGRDPKTAALMICEYLLLYTTRLSEEEFQKMKTFVFEFLELPDQEEEEKPWHLGEDGHARTT